MDYVLKLIIFFAVSSSVFAVPALPTFAISRAGPTTTYKVLSDGTGTAVPLSPSSAGTGIKILDGVFNSAGNGYQTNARVGAEIPAVKVSNGVTAANLAAAVLAAVPKLSTLGMAIAAGTALYQYLDDAGLTADGQGGIAQKIPTTTSCGTLVPCYNSNTKVYYFLNTYGSGPLCPSGSYFNRYTDTPNVDVCSITSATPPPPTPISIPEAQPVLAAKPPQTADGFSQVMKELHDRFGASGDPVASSPTVSASSSSVTSAPEQTVNPDGTVQTKTDTTTFTQDAPDTISATTNTTTTTTHVDGSTTTTVTNNAPPSPDSNPPTDCDKHPDNIGCSKFGSVSSDTLGMINVPIGINPTSLGFGTCPAPQSLVLHTGTVTLSYQPQCDFATGISPVVISLAWLAAGMLVFGSIKES